MAAHDVPVISVELDAEPESVAAARRMITTFAVEHGASSDLRARIALGLSEAVANAVRHAYPGGGGKVWIHADVDDDTLEVVVDDDGVGFHAGSSQRPGLGAGMKIIADVSDTFGIRERLPNGTEVWMRFKVGPTH